ncbi:MAG: hypothetical protein ACXWLH_03280 [Candidatus Saccharimonadales bacterium]
MANSKADKSDKVFDVAKPGKTAASASSRPLIVGHKAILKDPMVNESSVSELNETKTAKPDLPSGEDLPSGSPQDSEATKPADDEPLNTDSPSNAKINIKPPDEAEDDGKITVSVGPKTTKTSKNRKKIVPLAAESANVTTDEKSEAAVDISPETEEPESADDKADKEEESPKETDEEASVEPAAANDDKQDSETADKTAADKPETQDSPASDSDTEAKTDSVAVQAQKKAEKEAQEAAAKNEQLEQEIASGQYFVPIGEKTRKKRSLRHILIGIILILLLGLALADLMIDVGIIKTNIKPPISVFNGGK